MIVYKRHTDFKTKCISDNRRSDSAGKTVVCFTQNNVHVSWLILMFDICTETNLRTRGLLANKRNDASLGRLSLSVRHRQTA